MKKNYLEIFNLSFSQPEKVNLRKIDLNDFLIFLEKNKVLYVFLKNIKKRNFQASNSQRELLEQLIIQTEKVFNEIYNGTEFIKRFLQKNKIEFLFPKTFKIYPYLFSDIDVVVKQKDFERTVDLLSKSPQFFRDKFENPFGDSKVTFAFFQDERKGVVPWEKQKLLRWGKIEGALKFDLHWQLTWQGKSCFDAEKIFEDQGTYRWGKFSFPVPSKESELIWISASNIFRRRSLRLIDMKTISAICWQKINWRLIQEQIKKYQWSEEFNYLLSLVYSLEDIYSTSLELEFPFIYSRFWKAKNFLKRISLGTIRFNTFSLFYYLFSEARFYASGKKISGELLRIKGGKKL